MLGSLAKAIDGVQGLAPPARRPLGRSSPLYDPQTGQFLSVYTKVGQTLEAFLYAGDDPVNRIDPSGQGASSCVDQVWLDVVGNGLVSPIRAGSKACSSRRSSYSNSYTLPSASGERCPASALADPENDRRQEGKPTTSTNDHSPATM